MYHFTFYSINMMLRIFVLLLLISSVDALSPVTVIGDCKCQDRRYSEVWANIRKQPSRQGSAGRPNSCETQSDNENMGVIATIEEPFLISPVFNEFQLVQSIKGRGCFMVYSWDNDHWTRCSLEHCVLELAAIPKTTLLVKLMCPSKALLRRMNICPILIGHSVQDMRLLEDQVILKRLPDNQADFNQIHDDISGMEEDDTECKLRVHTIPEHARSYIASRHMASKATPYSIMRCGGIPKEECACIPREFKSLPLLQGVSRPQVRMPFDFDFVEHITCNLVCFDDFPDSVGDSEDVERNNQPKKRKKGRG